LDCISATALSIDRSWDGTGRLQTSIEQDPAFDGSIGLHKLGVLLKI